MVLNSTAFIIGFGNAFSTGLIGTGGDIGSWLVGAILLIVIVVCLFSIRMGLFGAIVILPASIIIMSEADLIPRWISIAVTIISGIIVAWIWLSMVREG